MKSKLNFKQPKYIFPIIILPFVLFLGYKIIEFTKTDEQPIQTQKELSTSLGDVKADILSKNESYDKFYESREKRSMIMGIEDEKQNEKQAFNDNLSIKQKRYIDSLEIVREKLLKDLEAKRQRKNNTQQKYYEDNNEETSIDEDERNFQRQMKLLKMINGDDDESRKKEEEERQQELEEEKRNDPLKMMKKQMLFLDSLEQSKNPELQAKSKAQQRLFENQKKKEAFLNSTLEVSKESPNSREFNSISKKKKSKFIKAVIDESIKGYLGSRLRLRLLEDTFVGEHKMPKGTYLYAQISGFTLQRVNLNVVSVMLDDEIIPINLAIFDLDGLKGLYVPRSTFREMIRELSTGQNYMQNSPINEMSQGFFTSLFSGMLNSASEMIIKTIKANKVNLKYNSYVLLINERELNQNKIN